MSFIEKILKEMAAIDLSKEKCDAPPVEPEDVVVGIANEEIIRLHILLQRYIVKQNQLVMEYQKIHGCKKGVTINIKDITGAQLQWTNDHIDLLHKLLWSAIGDQFTILKYHQSTAMRDRWQIVYIKSEDDDYIPNEYFVRQKRKKILN